MSVTATTHGKRRSTGSTRTESIGFRILGWGLFLGVLVALGFASIPSHQRLPTSTSETLLWVSIKPRQVHSRAMSRLLLPTHRRGLMSLR